MAFNAETYQLIRDSISAVRKLWPEGLNPGETHRFLRRGDKLLDPTAGHFSCPIAYSRGRANGFLTTKPSKRARTLMERVK